jgi:hypothetical protein
MSVTDMTVLALHRLRAMGTTAEHVPTPTLRRIGIG